MEPQDKGKSDESLSEKNRDLLRLEAQEKRRREAPGEKDQFPGKTPIFAKPYKTDNKDALSRRIRNVLGDYNDFKEYMGKNLRKVIWFPKKIKSRSQTRSKCREPSSRQTKTFQSSVTEQPLKNSKTSESSELEPFLEKTNSTDAPSIEDILREMTFTISRPVSPLQSPPKADPSSTKQTNSTDVPSIEDILREMTFTISRPVSPLQSPPKAEPSSTKDTDGSAAQNQEQSGTGSGTLPSSQPGTLPSSQPRTSVLLDDLQLSDSEESDDNQVVEKPPSALVSPRDSFSTRWPRIPLQSLPRSVASSLSSSSESGSSSDSESSSGLETRQTVGIKRPGKPLVHDGSKRHRKEDSDPNPGDQGPVFQGLMLQSMSWDCSACSCKLWNAE